MMRPPIKLRFEEGCYISTTEMLQNFATPPAKNVDSFDDIVL